MFTRTYVTSLGNLTVKSSHKMLELDRMLCRNFKLIPAGKKLTNHLAVGLELMNYLIAIPDFFSYLLEKTGVASKEDIGILCSGSTLYMGAIPVYNIFLHYKAGESSVEVNTIGKDFCGPLPEMYQLVYEAPVLRSRQMVH